MRGPQLLATGLFAVALFGSTAIGADRNWVVGVGSGQLYSSATDGQWLGRSCSVSAASALRPWFLFGGEMSGYRIDGGEVDDYGWSGTHYRIEPWYAVVPAATFRVQPPVRRGLAPFVGASSGVSWSTGGDVRMTGPAYPRGYVEPRLDETVWFSSIEMGLRVVLPGAWPDPEASLRSIAWIGDDSRHLFEPRFALRW